MYCIGLIVALAFCDFSMNDPALSVDARCVKSATIAENMAELLSRSSVFVSILLPY